MSTQIPCDCGNPEAYWSGPRNGLRVYACEQCHLDSLKIENPNSSGQGYCAGHEVHAYHSTVVELGYIYSHSVFVTKFNGTKEMWHCYKHSRDKEHGISFPHSEDYRYCPWGSSCSPASGHKHFGRGGIEIRKHLKGKNSRYGLTPKAKGVKP